MNRERARDIIECLASGDKREEVIKTLRCSLNDVNQVIAKIKVFLPFTATPLGRFHLAKTFILLLNGERHSWVVGSVSDWLRKDD